MWSIHTQCHAYIEVKTAVWLRCSRALGRYRPCREDTDSMHKECCTPSLSALGSMTTTTPHHPLLLQAPAIKANNLMKKDKNVGSVEPTPSAMNSKQPTRSFPATDPPATSQSITGSGYPFSSGRHSGCIWVQSALAMAPPNPAFTPSLNRFAARHRSGTEHCRS